MKPSPFSYFFLSHCRSLHFIMQAAWRYLTECAICNPQLQSLSHYRCIAGSLTPLLPATVKQGGNDDAAVWRESERKERQTPKHLCGCRCFCITSVCSTVLAQLPFRCLTVCRMKSSPVILSAVQGSNLIDNTFLLSFDNLVRKYVTTVNQAVKIGHLSFSCFTPDCMYIILLPEMQLSIDLKVNHELQYSPI